MAFNRDDIKQNMDDMKKNVYGKKLENKAIGYKTGAIVGGAAGFLAGWLLRSKIMWWTIGGVVGGGYIGYKIAETKDPD